jgi:outer membrane receptor protein involved in Fe transport
MKGLRLRTEVYYQQLFNVPVSIYDTSSLSTLNIGENYILDPLTNKGKGKNYGVEISLEKQLRNNFYFLFSNSLYQSKYTAADGIERNTRYNGGHANSLTLGKEFIHPGKQRSFAANIKVIYAGGFRETPMDEEATLELGYAKYREAEAFTIQHPAYFRTDIRLSMKWNATGMTHVLSLDIQNLTNRQNIYARYFDSVKGGIRTAYQAGIIPVIAYRLEF